MDLSGRYSFETMDSSSLDNDLLRAIQEGNKETVKSLLENAPTDQVESVKESFLHVASQNGLTEIVELLTAYFDVNATIRQQQVTPLMLAIEGNHHETVKFLLEHGAKTRVPSLLAYYELFQSACENKHDEIVKILLEHGIRLYSTYQELQQQQDFPNSLVPWNVTLDKIISQRQLELLDTILSYEKPSSNEEIFKLSLERAVLTKNLNRTRVVLNFSVKRKEFFISECLAWWHSSTSLPIIQLLLDNGANPNIRLILDEATNSGRADLVKLLLYSGVRPTKLNRLFETALYIAIKQRHKTIVKMLLNNGSNINFETNNIRGKYLFRYQGATPEGKEKDIEIFKIVTKHIVELLAKGMFVEEVLVLSMNHDDNCSGYKQLCESEIELIKQQEFQDSRVTLFDLWNENDLIQLAAYLRNGDIEEFIKSEEFPEKFAIYCDFMRMKFDKAFERIYLEKRVCNFFISLSTREENRLPRLQHTCTRTIFSSLSNKDLKNLRESYF